MKVPTWVPVHPGTNLWCLPPSFSSLPALSCQLLFNPYFITAPVEILSTYPNWNWRWWKLQGMGAFLHSLLCIPCNIPRTCNVLGSGQASALIPCALQDSVGQGSSKNHACSWVVHRQFMGCSKVKVIHRGFKLHISPPHAFCLAIRKWAQEPLFCNRGFCCCLAWHYPKRGWELVPRPGRS